MSSIMNSNGVVLATAMAAVSGTVIVLALRLQKSLPTTPQFSIINTIPLSSNKPPLPRSCMSSDGKRRERKKKKVRFAEDVMDPTGNSEEFRRLRSRAGGNSAAAKDGCAGGEARRMPANRMALYNGILRDRVVHRMAYSY